MRRGENMVNKYLENEFYNCCPLMPVECGTIKVQIQSEKGKTRWFNITPEQFKQIENVLAYGYDVAEPKG